MKNPDEFEEALRDLALSALSAVGSFSVFLVLVLAIIYLLEIPV